MQKTSGNKYMGMTGPERVRAARALEERLAQAILSKPKDATERAQMADMVHEHQQALFASHAGYCRLDELSRGIKSGNYELKGLICSKDNAPFSSGNVDTAPYVYANKSAVDVAWVASIVKPELVEVGAVYAMRMQLEHMRAKKAEPFETVYRELEVKGPLARDNARVMLSFVNIGEQHSDPKRAADYIRKSTGDVKSDAFRALALYTAYLGLVEQGLEKATTNAIELSRGFTVQYLPWASEDDVLKLTRAMRSEQLDFIEKFVLRATERKLPNLKSVWNEIRSGK